MSEVKSHNQFELLKQRRFAPFFLTQFFGAFNDNVLKNSMLLLFTFGGVQSLPFNTDVVVNIAAGIFILPFFLWSATAGQLADKYDKALIMRRVKMLEIFIMLLASAAFFLQNFYLLIMVLFLMGSQSSFFGPAKYAILPQNLKPEELVGGNGLVEMGTFLAILLGTLGGTLLAGLESAVVAISLVLMVLAVLGYISSRSIPASAPTDPELKVNWNFFSQTWKILNYAKQDRAVFLSILGVSWFWFVGATYLTQIYSFTSNVLLANEQTVAVLLCAFIIGIAAGSLLCEKLSRRRVELGLVPLGSIGLSVFGIDLFFASEFEAVVFLLKPLEVLRDPARLRVLFDLMMIGLSGGLFIVPLYALIQQRTEESKRAQVIAANNILNALFMVLASLLGAVLLGVVGLSIPWLLLIVTVLNIVVVVYIYSQVPEFTVRFLVWMLTHTIYRVKHKGLDHIPEQGAAVLVCNHVSYVDALLLMGSIQRPMRFVMAKDIFDIPVLNYIFRTGKAIPITSQHVDKQVYDQAFVDIASALEEGELICIFPEGKLTQDGEIDEFKTGVERILEKTPVPVVPMALQGLWGSFFSHKDGHALTKKPKRFWSRVCLTVGEGISADKASAVALREKVAVLRGDAV